MTTEFPLTGIDYVARLEPGREAVGVRNVPATLALFDSHFPRFPVLPGVLLLQSMAQTAALALGDARGWLLDGAEVVRFRHAVRPGDRAVVTARVLDAGAEGASCSAVVHVEGRAVATARRLRLIRAHTHLDEATGRGTPT
jgi:3-hydroxyacyl-[acyl-carrier-protein] dehydratase